MEILALTRYTQLGASSRLRFYQYLPYLKQFGINVEVAPLLNDNYITGLYYGKGKRNSAILNAYLGRLKNLLGARDFNLLWIEKELFPFLPAWGEAMLKILKVPYIVDYDDAIFHNYDLHSSKLVRCFLGKKIDQVMKNADVVVVGNDYLGNRARCAGARKIEHIPTVIDLTRYKTFSKSEETPFTIGWIGSPATSKYIHLIKPALSEVCKNNKARVVLVGAGPVELDNVPVEIRPWTEESEVNSILNFDVGIMPLPDEPWERGKCGYKLIQYMACGKAVVASPVGVNRNIIEQGVNGFLADDMDDWVNALRELRENVSMRTTMGYAGRRKVEEEYCVQVTAPRLARIIHNVACRQC